MVYQSQIDLTSLPPETQRDILEYWTGMKPEHWRPTDIVQQAVIDIDLEFEQAFDDINKSIANPMDQYIVIDEIKAVFMTYFSPEIALIEIASNLPDDSKAKMLSIWITGDESNKNTWYCKELTRYYQYQYKIFREAGQTPASAKARSLAGVIKAFL